MAREESFAGSAARLNGENRGRGCAAQLQSAKPRAADPRGTNRRKNVAKGPHAGMISRVIRSVVILFLSLVCFGCRESKVEIVAHENYWRGGPPKELGALSENEVAAIRVKLNGVQFPAPEWTIQRLLPSTLKPVPAAFFDAGIADPKGRIGGVIQDYWLNSKSVLRVATAYYSIGEKHYSLEEWAELMTPKQAYQPVSRSPYSK